MTSSRTRAELRDEAATIVFRSEPRRSNYHARSSSPTLPSAGSAALYCTHCTNYYCADTSASRQHLTPCADDMVVFVGNLPWSVTEDELRSIFAPVGEVMSIRIAEDREGRRRGFGFVEFGSVEDAKKALEYDGVDLAGRQLRVDVTTRSSNSRALTISGGVAPSGAVQTRFCLLMQRLKRSAGSRRVLDLPRATAVPYRSSWRRAACCCGSNRRNHFHQCDQHVQHCRSTLSMLEVRMHTRNRTVLPHTAYLAIFDISTAHMQHAAVVVGVAFPRRAMAALSFARASTVIPQRRRSEQSSPKCSASLARSPRSACQ
jgi:hypothetical protein